MKIYERIRVYMEERGIKQTHVANEVGISVSTFNEIMHGRRALKADEIYPICRALRVSPELFVFPEDELVEGVV